MQSFELDSLLSMLPPGQHREAARGLASRDPVELRAELDAMLSLRVETCPRHGEWRPYQIVDGRLCAQHVECPECELQRRRDSVRGLPPRYAGASFDCFEVLTPVHAAAVRHMRGYATRLSLSGRCSENLVLLGPPGTGKTHLACALAREVAATRGVVYARMLDVVDALRRDRFGDAPMTEMDALVNVDLLILDEVGKQAGNDSEAVAAQRLIDGRYSANKPTVLIGNGDLDGMATCITPAGLDRIKGDGTVITLRGKSYRGLDKATLTPSD